MNTDYYYIYIYIYLYIKNNYINLFIVLYLQGKWSANTRLASSVRFVQSTPRASALRQEASAGFLSTEASIDLLCEHLAAVRRTSCG